MSHLKKQILIVDNDSELSESLMDMLSMLDFEVTLAQNGEEAQKLISTKNFNLVISDIQMPKMSGIQLVTWIRQIHEATRNQEDKIPIILMSGFTQHLAAQKAHNIEVQDFIDKPFETPTLIKKIESVLSMEHA